MKIKEENFDYTIPPSLEKDKEAKDTFTALMGYINMQYKKLQKFSIFSKYSFFLPEIIFCKSIFILISPHIIFI